LKPNFGLPRLLLALAGLAILSGWASRSRVAGDQYEAGAPAPGGPTYRFQIQDVNNGKSYCVNDIPHATVPAANKKEFDFVFDTKTNAEFAAFIRSAMPSNRAADEVYSAVFSQYDATGSLTTKWDFKQVAPYDLIPQTDPATGDMWFDVIVAYQGLK
jgi:hypothetical protein